MKRYHAFTAWMIMGCLMGSPASSWAAAYRVDKDHTHVSFKIRNFASDTQGFFGDFEGTVDYDPDKPDLLASQGTIDVRSIDTQNASRDHHLLSKDFFDVSKYPVIGFKSAEGTRTAGGGLQVNGLLKIHGIEKSVPIQIQHLTLVRDPGQADRLRFTATAHIDRKDFGLTYDSAGLAKMALGDQVAITLDIDAVRI